MLRLKIQIYLKLGSFNMTRWCENRILAVNPSCEGRTQCSIDKENIEYTKIAFYVQ